SPVRPFFSMFRLPPISTLFPYTTLFRSGVVLGPDDARRAAQPQASQHGLAMVGRSVHVDQVVGAFAQQATQADDFGQHRPQTRADRKSTRLNSSHVKISYAVFCLKKKTK